MGVPNYSSIKAILNTFSKRKDFFIPLLIPAIFIIGIIAKTPIRQVFDYYPDEGYALMGSSLFLKGFPLYNKIWLDQTPLLTVILSYWLKLFGASVYSGRILILIFSGILLWAFYQIIKNQWGRLCALIAVVFLIFSNAYARLSVSVMIGIPALAFLMLSVYCLAIYRKNYSKYLLVLSGIFMALSLQTKLFTLFLLPFIALEVIQTKGIDLECNKKEGYAISAFLLWFIGFLAAFLVITVIFFHFNFSMFVKMLFQSHIKGELALRNEFNFSVLRIMILRDYDTALLALTGIALIIREKKWRFIFPVLWLVSAFVMLLCHRPVFDHYYPLISIPMCWLAAVSCREFFHGDMRKGWFTAKDQHNLTDVFFRWLTAGLIIATILPMPIKYYRTRLILRGEGPASPQEQAVVNLLKKYKTYTPWVVTDRPIFAFYADMLVPPEFAIICHKRNFIDEEEQDYFIDTLQKYRVKLILLYRLKHYGPKIISYIEKNYEKIYQDEVPKRESCWVSRKIKPEIHKTKPVNYNDIAKFIFYRWLRSSSPYFAREYDKRNIALYIDKEFLENYSAPFAVKP